MNKIKLIVKILSPIYTFGLFNSASYFCFRHFRSNEKKRKYYDTFDINREYETVAKVTSNKNRQDSEEESIVTAKATYAQQQMIGM